MGRKDIQGPQDQGAPKVCVVVTYRSFILGSISLHFMTLISVSEIIYTIYSTSLAF